MCVCLFLCLFIFIEIQNPSWTTGSSFFADQKTSRNGSDPMVLNSLLLSTESSRASTGFLSKLDYYG